MFSIVDFVPTLAAIVGGTPPTGRPSDDVAQSDVLFGQSEAGHRECCRQDIQRAMQWQGCAKAQGAVHRQGYRMERA
jgi:hypothetical protein